MAEEKTRAERFIEAFNNIDYSLRTRYGLNRSMSFSDLIRKSVVLNYIVRKYEDELIDYSRLRNAIVHQSSPDKTIAEPHEDVVEKIEKIDRLINTPPRAIDTVSRRDILCVEHNESIENVIKLIASSGYSNIPVFKDGGVEGIANGQRILDLMGQILISGGDVKVFLQQTIETVITSLSSSVYYVLKDEKTGLYYAIGNEETYRNVQRKGMPDPTKMTSGMYETEAMAKRRCIFTLSVSEDLRNWKKLKTLIDVTDWEKGGVSYPSFIIDGDDILYVSRTSGGSVKNEHDNNYVTFHRIENFRELK